MASKGTAIKINRTAVSDFTSAANAANAKFQEGLKDLTNVSLYLTDEEMVGGADIVTYVEALNLLKRNLGVIGTQLKTITDAAKVISENLDTVSLGAKAQLTGVAEGIAAQAVKAKKTN